GLEDSQQIGRVVIHPTDPDVVYVAALGHPYGPNAERGVFRSRNGGRSWQRVLGDNNDTGAIDLAFEPGNPNVIYASMWQTRRTPTTITPSGSIRSIPSAASSASIRERSSRSTAGVPGVPGTTSRPASSITSSPTTASHTGFTDRSRTPARRACRAAPARSTA